MRLEVPIVLILVVGTASAEDLTPGAQETAAAVARGLDFVAKDAMAWKSEHNCASCHHAALVVWAMSEAKQKGYSVDEAVRSDLTRWMAESGDGKTSLPRPKGNPKALNTKAVYFAIALNADPNPDAASREGRARLSQTVLEDQTEDGSWSSWPDSRPPILATSDVMATQLATLALLRPAEEENESARIARDRAMQWLSATKTDDPQSTALRLLLWRRLGRPAEEWEPLRRRIQDRQNPDGGWSQSPDLPSDAWATGQALYVLVQSGLKLEDPAILRGRDFLVTSQRPDGSWPMVSRPIHPGGAGAKSLIPITAAGSSWALLGLVATTPARSD